MPEQFSELSFSITKELDKTLKKNITSFKERMHYCSADVTSIDDCNTLIKETISMLIRNVIPHSRVE